MGLATAVLFAALAAYASAHCAQNSDCSSFPDLNGFHFFCNNDEHVGLAGECETCYYPGDIPHDSEACVRYVTACCYTGQSERRYRCECEDDEAEFQNIEAHKETGEECPGGHANLRIDLYDGVVRDADTDDWWELDWGDSDAYCVLYVDEASEKFTGLFINSNTPVYNEFMDFSCQRTDAGIRLNCYDRDEWSNDDPIFSTYVNDWPPSGVKTRWYDEVTETFYFDVALIYGHGVAPHHGRDFYEDDDQDDDQDEEKRNRVRSAGLFFLMIMLIASFCCGAAFVQTQRRKNREPNFEVTGVEMAAAVDIIDLAQATVIPASDVKGFETVELGGGGPEAAPTPHAVA